MSIEFPAAAAQYRQAGMFQESSVFLQVLQLLPGGPKGKLFYSSVALDDVEGRHIFVFGWCSLHLSRHAGAVLTWRINRRVQSGRSYWPLLLLVLDMRVLLLCAVLAAQSAGNSWPSS